MRFQDNDTIIALSSGALPAGIAVIRFSGLRTRHLLESFCGSVPEPRYAAFRSIRNRNGLLLDQGLALFFPGPHSFTGEDSGEFHVHGSRAVVASLLAEMASIAGCRLAEAGEFSRRAFENGKLDLLEIEGLADLLASETEMQRRQAIAQAEGGATRLYASWREKLVHCRAMIEAELDFADEDDIPGSVSQRIWPELRDLLVLLRRAVAGEKQGEIIRDGYHVVIAGAPNAGKSSLMNGLAGREVAIVTHYAGTTRDILQVDLDLEGYVVRLYDTAGIRSTDEVVEKEGIRRALIKVQEADLVLYLHDMTSDHDELDLPASVPVIKIGTKCDLGSRKDLTGFERSICTTDQTDLDWLKHRILESIRSRFEFGEGIVPSRLRHVEQLKTAAEFVEASLVEDLGLEVRADFLRSASDALERLIGRVDTETLLGKIFSEFCVGK
ncbi:tRNA uridine-5-carboxymethylaminomethyl(34) synthesis GTPase MnmE [Allorhizobium undicola]|uniref:tRNA uridine-5-carboxymethylaminomethyl(34) synthesis GTPase MnmE n=1 Tax=Allorhizobium undicola TaxID=78527 RepID=UPI000488EF04|nr:tRNA uridine-5-carboxymethylaminomethyl(34) synthesis GTPase MnmE [Allorhizobium undicola]